jgi:hypothetical protein
MFGHNPLSYGNISHLLSAETFNATEFDQDNTQGNTMTVTVKWEPDTETYWWMGMPYNSYQDTLKSSASTVKDSTNEPTSPDGKGVKGRVDAGHGLVFESLSPEDSAPPLTHWTTELSDFTKYGNKSLYPGLGGSDLYKPDERKEVRGAGACAKKCADDPACVAFHLWSNHPDEDTVENYCYFWSKNMNPDETYTDLSEALSDGDEGKGSGYRVDAYIKNPPAQEEEEDEETTTTQNITQSSTISPTVVVGGIVVLGLIVAATKMKK